ncbi:hypothetical protein KY092_07965 [Natronomonas gomsonensis]|uniref:hypothetical protein n=1 Tax=Natronomonas gomsonensis TaxID=1046043 RepID=UPI0020CA8625|nr:hypothetical protein [Natronomonas gomsonensis]MCY4730492.1 hypothetical protein [Natronomonas gomsonensis]
MNEKPSWTPKVSVAGLGKTGRKTIQHIQTESSAQLLENPSPSDIPEDTDFLFLTAEVTDLEIHPRLNQLLEETEAVKILFAEGLTSTPENLMEQVNLLVPIKLKALSRGLLPSFIADMFEAMLPMTVQDLGNGEIAAVAGNNRMGKLYIDTPNNEYSAVGLTPGVRYETPEHLLFFHCSGEKQPPGKVQRKIDEYQFSNDLPVLWDQRVHPRYIGKPHVKYLITFDAGDDNVHWDREKQERKGETDWSVEDNRFIERKEDG